MLDIRLIFTHLHADIISVNSLSSALMSWKVSKQVRSYIWIFDALLVYGDILGSNRAFHWIPRPGLTRYQRVDITGHFESISVA